MTITRKPIYVLPPQICAATGLIGDIWRMRIAGRYWSRRPRNFARIGSTARLQNVNIAVKATLTKSDSLIFKCPTGAKKYWSDNDFKCDKCKGYRLFSSLF
jgi:hypothetical protein